MKPQSVRHTLDGEHTWPHLRRMAEQENDRKSGATTREAKLAQALRANLRRRKAGGAPAPAQKPDNTPTD